MAVSKEGAHLNSGCLAGAESNPLLNEVVLQTLFEHATLADLRNWRKVCKLWFEVSLRRWRREAWVNLTESERDEERLFMGKYVDLMIDHEEGALEVDFYQFWKHPFRRFKFEEWHLTFEAPEKGDKSRQDEFWDKCVAQTTHLEFKDCSFRTFQSLLSIICESIPNLEALRLLSNWYWNYRESTDHDEWEDWEEENTTVLKSLTKLEVDFGGGYEGNVCYCFTAWNVFGRVAPNLKSLALAKTGDQLQVILKGMKPPNDKIDSGWKVEKLDMLQIGSMKLRSFEQADFVDSLADEFCQLRLPLTELSLDIGTETSMQAFKLILETYAVSLRKLVVYRGGSVFGFEDEDENVEHFPFGVNLHTLSELWLVGSAVSQNLNFLRFIPNLKRLLLICNIGRSLVVAGSFLSDQKTLRNLLKGRNWKELDFDRQNNVIPDTDFCQLENVVCSKLEEFVVSGKDQGCCTPKHVAALTRLMPNLKRVMLGLGNDGFRVVCENWKELEGLVVQPCGVDEVGITGIIPGLKNYSRLPNITGLKYLRYFGMGYETMAGINDSLSDDSYFNGVAELAYLRDLRVTANEMSEEVRDRLIAKFPNGMIDTEGLFVLEWELDDPVDQKGSDFKGVLSGDDCATGSDDESINGACDDVMNEEDQLSVGDADSE